MDGDLAAFLTARLDEDQEWAETYHQPPIGGRMLREVAAKRAILALHRPEQWNVDDVSADVRCAECTTDDDLYKPQMDPCATVLALAAVYRDHPGYDPAWAPETAR